MNFHINKDATLPILKMELIKDGRYSFREFHDKIQNSNIYFSMSDINTGVKKIGKRSATCILKSEYNGCEDEEYYISYQFSRKDTSKPGTYIGKFIIEFLDGSGTLIVPIREELIINVLEGSIKK
jgi:Sec7-like guanine-nucleotide exchange factor